MKLIVNGQAISLDREVILRLIAEPGDLPLDRVLVIIGGEVVVDRDRGPALEVTIDGKLALHGDPGLKVESIGKMLPYLVIGRKEK